MPSLQRLVGGTGTRTLARDVRRAPGADLRRVPPRAEEDGHAVGEPRRLLLQAQQVQSSERLARQKECLLSENAACGYDCPRVPHKSLCNIPGLFAEMMIQQGWILRNEIIWYKPSVIPMSAKDRFTVDFEKLFFFTKSTKYDFRQQFEPYAECTIRRYRQQFAPDETYRKYGYPVGTMNSNPNGRNKRCVWRITTEPNRRRHYASYPTKLIEIPIEAGCPLDGVVLDPFLGSGTTAVVAQQLGRRYIGIEPNPEYVKIAKSRLEKM